eukprot:4784877-Pleurochrysis_carterae.AAC.1
MFVSFKSKGILLQSKPNILQDDRTSMSSHLHPLSRLFSLDLLAIETPRLQDRVEPHPHQDAGGRKEHPGRRAA